MSKAKFAPKEIFDQMLEWSVIPTFDLVLEYGGKGVIIVKRKIAPYEGQWALPGLRMLKGEGIDDTLSRIAKKELGLTINTDNKKLLGQFVGKFKTEHQRQDLSTGYLIIIDPTQEISLNKDHFSSYKIVKSPPKNMGAMYKYYFQKYLNLIKKSSN